MRCELVKASLSRFILAGRATFTIENLARDTHRTFKVVKVKNLVLWHVYIRTCKDNKYVERTKWTACGSIIMVEDVPHLIHDDWSQVEKKSPSYKEADWMVRNMNCMTLPQYNLLNFFHEGRCGRCGLRLTDPDSIRAGFGPYCINHV